MKGTIAVCLEDLVRTHHGDDAWKAICAKAGLPENHRFKATGDVPDGDVLALIGVAADSLGITQEQAFHAFGIHWSTTYAPKIYGHFFKKARNARDFLLSLDKIHDVVTKTVKNAAPPRFSYDADDPTTLVMHYNSARGLVALMPGLAEGVGQYYGEQVEISLSGDAVKIGFKDAKYRKAA